MFVLESSGFADSLLNRAIDAAFCVNESGYFLYVNNAMCHLTGYSREQLMQMSLFDVDTGTLLKNWVGVWEEIKKEPLTLTSKFRNFNSQTLPVEILISYAEENGVKFGCGYLRHPRTFPQPDNHRYELPTEFSSDYKKTEADLEASLALLRSTLESTANGILAVNFEGEILCYNQKFMDMWRLPITQVRLSKSCERAKAFFESQVKDPEMFLRCVWDLPPHIDSERYNLIELKDGRIFAHYSEPHRLKGEIIGRVWSIWDITESQQTEQALRVNEARFRTLAETNQASIFLIRGIHLCYANPAAETLTGYTLSQMISEVQLDKLFKSKRLRQVNKESGGASEYQEMQIVTKSGVERWLACTVASANGIFDFNNELVQLITAIDITDYKQAESEVLQALEQAKLLSELRERFVSMLCHQFRTPLNVVSFSADLLRRHIHQWNEEKNRSYLDLILTAVEQLGHLLDDILLYGKADAAKLESQPRQIELDKFCRDIAMQVQLADGNQKLIDVINHENLTNVYLDPKLLQHILNNLLSNAVKYSPIGSTITLNLTRKEQNILFQVNDTGIGIPAIDQSYVFEPFYRGNNIDSIPGSGLGLSIVKTLVELHCGKISFDSKVGVGTTFVVTLPSK